MLELAQACAHLRRMVAVSATYVSPHPGGEGCVEELVALPRPAESLAAVQGALTSRAARRDRAPQHVHVHQVLSEHPSASSSSVPLTIVRPSIVRRAGLSDAGLDRQHAAFAGFVVIGAGHLKAIEGQAALDVVPTCGRR